MSVSNGSSAEAAHSEGESFVPREVRLEVGRDLLKFRTCTAQGIESRSPCFIVGVDRFQKDSSFVPRDLHLRPAVLKELGRITHVYL